MGPWDEGGTGYRYSPPGYPPGIPTRPPTTPYPGYTSPRHARVLVHHPVRAVVYEEAVGLKSVAQLTLDAVISGFQGMTEVYNLVNVGRINNHYDISGND